MESQTNKRDGKAGRRPTSSRMQRDSLDIEGQDVDRMERVTTRSQFATVSQHGKIVKGRYQSTEDSPYDDDSVEVGAT